MATNVIELGKSESYDTGNDPIIVRNDVNSIIKGVMLDVTGWTEEVISAGHVVIAKDGVYKPMPVTDGAYGSLPEGYAYAGITKVSVLATHPFVGVVNMGEINEEALPYSISSIKDAIKTAVPTLIFDSDR